MEIYNNYTEYDEGTDYIFEKEEYTGRLNYYNIILNHELTSICENNCELCYKESINYCLTCKYNFSLYKENGEIKKNCHTIETKIIENKSENICTKEDIIKNKCTTIYLTQIQLEELYKEIKDYYLNNNYNGDNKVIQTKNVIFQISKVEEQENSDNNDISNIDLGKCVEKLKSQNGISEEESLTYWTFLTLI